MSTMRMAEMVKVLGGWMNTYALKLNGDVDSYTDNIDYNEAHDC